MMTYAEAQTIADERDKAWQNYYESQGKPSGKDYNQCVENAPKGLTNYNIVSRSNGLTIAAISHDDGKVFEYPCGILSWGYSIPEEAFLTPQQLEEPCWDVISRLDTFDW
jgi:hypothetical protein